MKLLTSLVLLLLPQAFTVYFAFAENNVNVHDELKRRVSESQKDLGVLEGWQKKIFDEEVVAQSSRFIRDYRPTNQGLSVDVDIDGIKKYLKFFAPLALKSQDPKLLVLFNVDLVCEKCKASIDEIQKLVKTAAERRGFVPVFQKVENNSSYKLNEIMGQKGALGALALSWRAAGLENSDSAHADEKHYQISSSFYLKAKNFEFQEGRLDVMEDESFLEGAGRLLTTLFSDLGAMRIVPDGAVALDGAVPSEGVVSGREELLLEVSGIRDFAYLNQVKAALVDRFNIQGGLEERKLSRGKVVFGFGSGQGIDELKKRLVDQLSGLKLANGILAVVEVSGLLIRSEIRGIGI